MKWIDALKKYNEGNSKWCIPKKNTSEHKKVVDIMRGVATSSGGSSGMMTEGQKSYQRQVDRIEKKEKIKALAKRVRRFTSE